MFYNISSSYHGGAIYTSCPNTYNGAVVLNYICAVSCSCASSSSYFGSFSYILSSNSRFTIFQQISILYSPLSITGQYSTLYFSSSNHTLKSSNTTLLQAHQSPIHFISSTSVNMIFSNLENTYSPGGITLYFNGGSFKNLKLCNFVNNSTPSYSIIYLNGNERSVVNDCIFFNNKNTLFSSSSGELAIYNCYISHGGPTIVGNQYVIIFDSIYEITSTYHFTNFGTYLCETPIPPPDQTYQVNDLTVCATQFPPPTPYQTIPNPPTTCIILSTELGNILILFSNFYFLFIFIL